MTTSTRDLLNHASGKGDKPRTRLDDNFRKRFLEIDWPVVTPAGFVKRGNKQIKKYKLT